MSDTRPALPMLDLSLADPMKLMTSLARISEQATLLLETLNANPEARTKQAEEQLLPSNHVSNTLNDVMQAHLKNPEKLMEAQAQLWQQYTAIWNNAWARALNQPHETVVQPAKSDRRFKDASWSENAGFDGIKQAYLATAQWLNMMVQTADVDEQTKRKAKFYVENIVNAFSPSNYLLTNPEALKVTLASSGENLLRGMERLRRDIDPVDGKLRVSQVNNAAFKVGGNIAVTPGKVVFRNEVFELIQYTPIVARTFAVPLLIVPPWINKYYILDLNEQKSFVKFCVDNGLTVFIMSWANADENLGRKNLADYMCEGVLEAIGAVQKTLGVEKVNTVGFCIGGSLLAATTGYLAAKGKDWINATTFLTTQVDFEKAGDLKVYVDEDQICWIEDRMNERGFLPGTRMAEAFTLLRSNELLWSFAVNSYLLDKEPAPFDLLFWNSDSTRMPAGVHSFYLRECYLDNKLAQGKMVLDNVRIDLSRVKIPVYNLACRDDHIAPAVSVFRLGRHFGGETTMVVSGSGHVAGVVNPPALKKYQYWTNEAKGLEFADWMASATETPGSWWSHWIEWITARSGDRVTAPQPGEGALSALCDAPGCYVLGEK